MAQGSRCAGERPCLSRGPGGERAQATAGVLLAAGSSRRMGGRNKLLLPVGGVPLVRRVALALLDAGLSPVVVVLGADAGAVRGALAGLSLRFVRNERHAEGMGTSLACGVAALGPGVEAVAATVGDLPSLQGATVRAVSAAWGESGLGAAVPVFRGQRGHPVFFDLGRYRERLSHLDGDRGARALLAENPEDTLLVPVDDPGVTEDVDTPAAYARATGGWGRPRDETSGKPGQGPGARERGGETPTMIRDDGIIRAINQLWTPVYPYLADHVLAVSGLRAGEVLDMGPFSGGLAVEILDRCPGFRAVVQDETGEVPRWAEVRARGRGVAERLTSRVALAAAWPWPAGRFDLVLVRGAFFFLTEALLQEAVRVLRPGGLAWVGGGYGPRTPAEVIEPLARRSRSLNALLGKRWTSAEEARALVDAAGLGRRARVREHGGLWIEVHG